MPAPHPSSIPGIGKVVGRVDRAIRWRADEQVDERIRHELAEIRSRLDEMDRRIHGTVEEHIWTAEEMRRVAPQVAAIEVRLEDIRQAAESPTPMSDTDIATARSLIDDIRREHDRAKARLDSASWYEDRLRQLEDAVAQLAERLDDA